MAGSTATASATVPPSAGGIHEHCSLTHVVNPTKFFIATQQMVDAHEVMKDALKSRFEDETPPRVGGRSRRFLVYIHGEFQRAEVEFGNPGSDDVLLIDVGRNVHVPREARFRLPDPFRSKKPFCVRAHLSDVKSPEASVEAWPRKAAKYFVEKVGYSNELRIIQRGQKRRMVDGTNSLPVEIAFKEKQVDGIFSQARIVERTASQAMLSEGLAVISSTMEEDEVESPAAETTAGEEEDYFTDAPDSAAGQIVKWWLPPSVPDLPDVGSGVAEAKVKVTFVDDAGQIYVHLSTERRKLADMDSFFHLKYGLEEAHRNDDVKWSVGAACMVKFADLCHDSWFRARILQLTEATKRAVVYRIDYGDFKEVPFCDLRQAYDYGYASVPAMAFRIVLDDVVPVAGAEMFNWPELELMYDQLHFKKFKGSAKHIKVWRTRGGVADGFPIPVKMEVLDSERDRFYDYGEYFKANSYATAGRVDTTAAKFRQSAHLEENYGYV